MIIYNIFFWCLPRWIQIHWRKRGGRELYWTWNVSLWKLRTYSLEKTQIIFHKCLRFRVLLCRRDHKHIIHSFINKCLLRAYYILGACAVCWSSSDKILERRVFDHGNYCDILKEESRERGWSIQEGRF